jgi:antitoxin component YwqK of YwqJK toxin-antitoxin module
MEYYPDGELKEVAMWCNNQIIGDHKEWYRDGTLYRHGFDNGNKLERECKTYYDDGRLADHIIMYNGASEGVYRLWHENGQLQAHEPNHKGKKDGICKMWYDTGIIEDVSTYRRGLLEGQAKLYHSDGSLRSFEYYSRNKKLADLTWKIVMSLLWFKNILRIRARRRIMERVCQATDLHLPRVLGYMVGEFCI